MATHVYTTGIDGPSGSSFALRIFSGERHSYSWNPSSIEPFIEIDYGLNSLALTPTAFVDGGSVRDTEAVEVDDWGRIIYTDTNFPFGELRPVSNTTWTVVHAWVGTGTVFERGDTYYRLVAPYIVTGTLHVTGNTVTHWVPSIKTDGLFGIQSLTDIAFSKQELGSGNLFNIGNGFSLRSRAYETQGVIEVSGNADVAFQPNWVGSGTVEVDGSAPILRTFGYEASGTLPALNSKDERRTYSYNTSSVVPFRYLDFGTVPLQTYQHITSNQTLSGVSSESIVLVDPGVTASVSPQYQVALPVGTPQNTIEYAPVSIGKTTSEDWGFINVTGTKFPFGVSRLKSETLINFIPNYVVQGDISVFGVAIAKTNPIWKGFIINKVSGVAITNFSLLHPGSGNLFSIGGGEETRAYAYAGSGDLFNFVSTEERVATDYVGSGSIKFSNAAHVSFAPNWISEGVIDVTGAASDIKRTFAQDEVGNLFVFTGDAYHERRTYDYNDSSISFFRYENFGFIPSSASVQTISGPQTISGESTDPVVRIENTVTVNPTFKLILNANTVPTAVYDHGTITEGYSGNIDWGFISQTVTNYPFGKFLYNGAAKTNFSLRHIGDGEAVLSGEGRARVNPQWFAEIQIEVLVVRSTVSPRLILDAVTCSTLYLRQTAEHLHIKVKVRSLQSMVLQNLQPSANSRTVYSSLLVLLMYPSLPTGLSRDRSKSMAHHLLFSEHLLRTKSAICLYSREMLITSVVPTATTILLLGSSITRTSDSFHLQHRLEVLQVQLFSLDLLRIQLSESRMVSLR